MRNIYHINVKKVLEKLNLKYRVVGDNLQLPCPNPLHHDSLQDGGSFYIHTKDLVFNCFGCDWQGSVFSLIMLLQHLSFDEAVDWLKEEGNFNFNSREFLRLELGKRLKSDIEKALVEENNPFFLPKLENIQSERIFNFFKKRNISKKIALQYGAKICFEGFYRSRIVIPILQEGHLYGFEARIIDKSLSDKKCLYPPNSSIKDIIFDQDHLNFENLLYFTEGMMDCLSLKSRGYLNSSCSFGSKLKKPQIKILNKFKKICLIPDNDIGKEGKTKGGDEIVNTFYTSIRMPEVEVVILPLAKDVDECNFRELQFYISKRISISNYIVERDLHLNIRKLSNLDLKKSPRLNRK